MSELFTYFGTVGPKWIGVVSAVALFGVEPLARAYWPWLARQIDKLSNQARTTIEVFILIIALGYAGFSAWSEEHEARTKLEQRSSYSMRRLTGEQRVQLVTTLRKAGGQEQGVEINSAGNSDECEEFAEEIRVAINSVPGWNAGGGSTIFGTAAVRGIKFDVQSLDARSAPILKLAEAFDAAQLKFEWVEDAQMVQGYEYRIFIARQPRP